MSLMRTILGISSVLLLTAVAVPTPVAADPCVNGCANLEVEPCAGSFAEGYSSYATTWTLTYTHPGGTVTQTLYGFAPPPAATSPQCWIPGCYSGTLSNDRGLYLSSMRICIE